MGDSGSLVVFTSFLFTVVNSSWQEAPIPAYTRSSVRPAHQLWLPWLLVFAACQNTPPLPIEVSDRELVVVVSSKGGRLQTQFIDGLGLRLDADEDRPVFAFRLRAEDYQAPDGHVLTREELRTLSLGFVSNEGVGSFPPGSCGRCLALSRVPPFRFSPGDACPIPAFEAGASFQRNGGGYRCAGAPNSPLCMEGTPEEATAIEAVRRGIRIQWPGPCACEIPDQAPSLRGLTVQGILPEEAPLPLSAFARLQDGRIAGFSDVGYALLDPNGLEPRIHWVTPPWGVGIRSALTLDSGAVLAFGPRFNTGLLDVYTFLRFEPTKTGLTPPQRLDTATQVRPRSARYLARGEKLPLFLFGSVNISGNLLPGLAACNDDLQCQDVSLERCRDERNNRQLRGVSILPDGTGVGVSDTAVYLKAPRESLDPLPLPTDSWVCTQPEGPFPADDGASSLRVSFYREIAHLGNRVFICVTAEPAPCETSFAAVLTATVAGTPDAALEPDLRVAYRAPARVFCENFLPNPVNPQQLRLVLSGGRTVDFDAEGHVVEQGTAIDDFGQTVSVSDVVPLDDDHAIFMTPGHRVFEVKEGRATLIYGPKGIPKASFRAIVSIGPGSFLAFGDPAGVWEITGGSPDSLPTTRFIPDADGILTNLQVHTAAWNTQDQHVLLGGRQGDVPFLIEVEVDDRIRQVRTLTVPSDFDGLTIQYLTSVGPARFVAATEQSRLLAIEDGTVTAVDIDWDDPTTTETEGPPFFSGDDCRAPSSTPSVFRDLEGSAGVAWAVGDEGSVLRVIGTRAERFAVPNDITFDALAVTCPDIAHFGAMGLVETGGAVRSVLELYTLTSKPDPFDPRGLSLLGIGKTEIEAVRVGSLRDGTPVGILRDFVAPGQPPFAVVHTNGFLFRPFSTDPIEYIRAPFDPTAVVQSEDGTVLFGADQGRLAIGRLRP